MAVGKAVGSKLGLVEGENVGDFDGIFVGVKLGFAEGVEDGFFDG
jgi:hypothetical protein